MRIIILLVIVASQFKRGLCWLHMLSRGHVVIASVGEIVQLECKFHTDSFNLFDNPLLWEKTQYSSEAFHVNMMGKILEPFASTRRFNATLTQKPPNYSLLLTIAEAHLEDNGNYTCVVNGPENKRLGLTQHALIVTAMVDGIVITASDYPKNVNSSEYGYSNYSFDYHQRSLVFTENVYCPLRCVAQGGYPPPEVTVHLAQRDVTEYFQLIRMSEVTGLPGLQLRSYVTVRLMRSTSNFRFTPEDDGKHLRCTASTQDVVTNYTTARVTVQYVPEVRCDSKSARLREANVFLRCEVRGRPKPSIKWTIDSSGSTITEDQETGDCYVINAEHRKGVVESQLIFRRLTRDSFRFYELVADNEIGTTRVQVELSQKMVSSTRKPMGVRTHNSRMTVKDRRSDSSQSLGVAIIHRKQRLIAVFQSAILVLSAIFAVT